MTHSHQLMHGLDLSGWRWARIQDAKLKSDAQKSITSILAPSKDPAAIQPRSEAQLWIMTIPQFLNEPAILDYATLLKSLPPDNVEESFNRLCKAAEQIAVGRQQVIWVSNQLTRQPTK